MPPHLEPRFSTPIPQRPTGKNKNPRWHTQPGFSLDRVGDLMLTVCHHWLGKVTTTIAAFRSRAGEHRPLHRVSRSSRGTKKGGEFLHLLF
ncbi:MAG: hypothetical protein B7Z37_31205 [Verrucomicrobia bacterium 12-59-8]|nr:MAG: hypothetical protein B7Z37_31205 [Verrucomicrobia bacterium 12-59-8]